MRRAYLTCAVLLAVASACNDATLPTATAGYAPNFGISDPPPPPVTGIIKGGLKSLGGSALSTFSQTAQNGTPFSLRVIYTMNPSATEGQIRNWVPITSNTSLVGRPLIAEHDGVIFGRGGFKVETVDGPILVDLTTVQGTILDPLRDGALGFKVLAKNLRTRESFPMELDLDYSAPENGER